MFCPRSVMTCGTESWYGVAQVGRLRAEAVEAAEAMQQAQGANADLAQGIARLNGASLTGAADQAGWLSLPRTYIAGTLTHAQAGGRAKICNEGIHALRCNVVVTIDGRTSRCCCASDRRMPHGSLATATTAGACTAL